MHVLFWTRKKQDSSVANEFVEVHVDMRKSHTFMTPSLDFGMHACALWLHLPLGVACVCLCVCVHTYHFLWGTEKNNRQYYMA